MMVKLPWRRSVVHRLDSPKGERDENRLLGSSLSTSLQYDSRLRSELEGRLESCGHAFVKASSFD